MKAQKFKNWMIFCVIVSGVSACGGEASDPTPPPPPLPAANAAPVITSPVETVISEIDEASAYQVEASDADGDTLTFGIDGGEDMALFTINNTSGLVSFAEPISFNAPADATGDNVYEVSVSVSDGIDTVFQLVDIQVTDVIGIDGVIEIDLGFDDSFGASSNSSLALGDVSGDGVPEFILITSETDVANLSLVSGSKFKNIESSFTTIDDLLSADIATEIGIPDAFSAFTEGELDVSLLSVQTVTGISVPDQTDTLVSLFSVSVTEETPPFATSFTDLLPAPILIFSDQVQSSASMVNIITAVEDGNGIQIGEGGSLTAVGDVDAGGSDDFIIVDSFGDEFFFVSGEDIFDLSVPIITSNQIDALQTSFQVENLGSVFSDIDSGDVDGDGLDDFLISLETSVDGSSSPNLGLVLGKSITPGQGGALPLGPESIRVIATSAFGPAASVSSSISIGDIDSDGFGDLAFTIPGISFLVEDAFPTVVVGALFVLFGDALNNDSDGIIDVAGDPASFGLRIFNDLTSISFLTNVALLGDVDGGGVDDLAIGFGALGSTNTTSPDTVVILFGESLLELERSELFLSELIPDDAVVLTVGTDATQNATITEVGDVGDLDGDGLADLIITLNETEELFLPQPNETNGEFYIVSNALINQIRASGVSSFDLSVLTPQ